MEVELTRDQQALIRQAIDTGRLDVPEDAAKEAFSSGSWRRASITEESMRQLA
jgi:hypothetical protein